MRQIRFLPAARNELEEIDAWYIANHAMGAAFVVTIEHALFEIAELPLAWPTSKVDARARARMLRQQPYAIVYLVEPERIIVVAIAHTSRRPGYWLHRLPPPK